jgi:hypothetical protein
MLRDRQILLRSIARAAVGPKFFAPIVPMLGSCKIELKNVILVAFRFFEFLHSQSQFSTEFRGVCLPIRSAPIQKRGLIFQEFSVMRSSPPIAPNGQEQDIYLVLDDFGSLGRAWRETDEAGANRSTLVRNLLDGQYENPVRIVAFNTVEGWSRDVTVDIADELRRRYVEFGEVPDAALAFMEAHRR